MPDVYELSTLEKITNNVKRELVGLREINDPEIRHERSFEIAVYMLNVLGYDDITSIIMEHRNENREQS